MEAEKILGHRDKTARSFGSLGVRKETTELLRRMGITEPTPVQEKTIPAARKGDLIVISATGTGKTLAYLLPVAEKLKRVDKGTGGDVKPLPQALVICPTRELAMQIGKVAKSILLEPTIIYGGVDISRQKEKLRQGGSLVIGTPGRLLDHVRRGGLDLGKVNRVVLDEADEMIKKGFWEDVELIIGETARDRQIMLFSATMPQELLRRCHHYMHSPKEIKIGEEELNIQEIVMEVKEEEKAAKLAERIKSDNPYLAIVFCNTKVEAAKLSMFLAQKGLKNEELHSDLSQSQRRQMLRRFAEGAPPLLVATDIAARGLDIEGITHIYNYGVPQSREWYIHRIGRTGRAGATGTAITLATPKEYGSLRKIIKTR